VRIFILVSIFFLSFVHSRDYYIYIVDDICQAAFPTQPHKGVIAGSYIVNDKKNKLFYQAAKSMYPGNFVVRKSTKKQYDNAIKNEMEKYGYKVLNFHSTLKGKEYTIEYKAINLLMGSYEYAVEVFKGKNSCKWLVSTVSKNKINEVEDIFQGYKQYTKFK